jgi:hypothetical protein
VYSGTSSTAPVLYALDSGRLRFGKLCLKLPRKNKQPELFPVTDFQDEFRLLLKKMV